ncbi:hypothetical protein [Stutzerimonas stutzeri]|uniref:hypothetical protein n=1 Tax=Stutzerimonas stutzeri TaxID=316 RepID=UPI002659DC68|nr:hypothetical protein [Stutzerimonas stutzeri]MCF6782597.1 hypothetical protein [Stutzerimonas stutzeri]MCF6805702.1 hypothetical protein [Stutzerimonas stutzeri]
MSKNNTKQHDNERSDHQQPGQSEESLVHLFRQLNEPDRQHVLRLVRALRDTSR